MKFELIQVLDKIRKLYQLPRTKKRFEKYLHLLQGDTKEDLLLPIAAFNPMGKELAKEQLEQLIQLNAEDLAAAELDKINLAIKRKSNRTIQVALNLVDDVDGSWSNAYTTDFKSKFEFQSLLKRNFCTPIFWTSESLTETLISQRTRAYSLRTFFWANHQTPETLQDLVEQEVFVQSNMANTMQQWNETDFADVENFYQANKHSTSYHLLFNFFYGDQASKRLEYMPYGMKENGGFEYAKFMASKKGRGKITI